MAYSYEANVPAGSAVVSGIDSEILAGAISAMRDGARTSAFDFYPQIHPARIGSDSIGGKANAVEIRGLYGNEQEIRERARLVMALAFAEEAQE